MGPYQIPDLSLLSSLMGKPGVIPKSDVGKPIQCVGLLKYYNPEIGSTGTWKKGKLVKESPTLASGTAIATFKGNLYLSNAHGNHACYFIKFLPDGSGFTVLEQHVPPSPNQIQTRDIKYGGHRPNPSPSDDGNAYSVVL